MLIKVRAFHLKKRIGMWLPLRYKCRYRVGNCIGCIAFEFYDIKSLYTKNDSERRLSLGLYITKYML